MDDAEEIRRDPEGWAKEEEAEMDAEHDKMASSERVQMRNRVAHRSLSRRIG